ncbi:MULTISPECIES: adenosine deaminase [Actinomadura]|uniref:adenosine deaminase n=1 Tax=Actinomadura yumaensis TaxID=111807 RepID=A0ABW2CJU0_9ACTN|nr:adenosine deaminase [Actinomadura sp. J1-007]MWK37895.1 adenosine deaminase [Actinomadura sp. J1-007]
MLINLHTHLEGRVRPTTAAELAARAGTPAPPRGWQEAIRLDAPGDLTAYLAKVSSTYPFFGSADALARITREAVEDAAADGQDYLELRFGPATHVRDRFGLDDVVAAALDGLHDGVRATGMPAGLVVAALRVHDAELNAAVARAAARRAGDGVLGFDLAGDELRYPDLTAYAEAFALARAAGLGITCHAAEAGPAHAAQDAVRLLGATRIGHGAHIADAPDVMRWAADHGIVVEVCPTSNWYTGATPALHHHPAPRFLAAGIPLVLGDDNPAQTGSPLSAEAEILTGALGFTTADRAALDATSVAAAFMDDSVRHDLRARLAAV